MSVIGTKKLKGADYLKPGEENTSPEYQAWVEDEICAAKDEAKDPKNLVCHREVRASLNLEH